MKTIQFVLATGSKPYRQRALVLQGGGTLGAYEAGVLEVLCQRLYEEDKENKREDSLLFDIVAGTSIGAMNGAILVSQYLQTQNWEKATEKLQKFWINQLSVKCLDIAEVSKPWYDQWINGIQLLLLKRLLESIIQSENCF